MIVKGGKWLRLMMVNATFSNILAYIVTVSFIGGGNRNNNCTIFREKNFQTKPPVKLKRV
jgi:hypothetical protein